MELLKLDFESHSTNSILFFKGKVLAMRSVLVSDWNGKSLSMSFTSSLEIDPKIQQAKDLSDFYHSLSSHEDFKSLTNQIQKDVIKAKKYHRI